MNYDVSSDVEMTSAVNGHADQVKSDMWVQWDPHVSLTVVYLVLFELNRII